MKAIIPIDPNDPEGTVVTVDGEHFHVIAERGEVVFIKFHSETPNAEITRNVPYEQRSWDEDA
jgi:hypothetical protein